MNWQEVIDKYFCSYMRLVGNNNKPPKNIRDLYDFFDEQGIGVFVTFWFDHNDTKLEYRYQITVNGTLLPCKPSIYSTRTEAEEQAFLKAFEILEEKLREAK